MCTSRRSTPRCSIRPCTSKRSTPRCSIRPCTSRRSTPRCSIRPCTSRRSTPRCSNHVPTGDPLPDAPSDRVPAGDPLEASAEEPALDLEGLFSEGEGDGGEDIGGEDREELDRLNQDHNELVREVGDTPHYQELRFAVPMRSRRSSEVNSRVRLLYLQIWAEGQPVLRCHSDRALELRNRRLREWLSERGVLCTTGEAQSPQQNGRAEAREVCENRSQKFVDRGDIVQGELALGYEVRRSSSTTTCSWQG